LRDPTSPNHRLAVQSLPEDIKNPKFVLTILFILSHGSEEKGLATDIRQLGGLILKNNAIQHFSEFSQEVKLYFKNEILHALSNELQEVNLWIE